MHKNIRSFMLIIPNLYGYLHKSCKIFHNQQDMNFMMVSSTIEHKQKHPSDIAWVFVYTPINLNTLKAVINTKIAINPR